MYCTVWKNENFSLTKKIFRQINSLVTYLVKPLLSRNFRQKCVRENSRNFHNVTLLCYSDGLPYAITPKKFREINYLVTSLVKN